MHKDTIATSMSVDASSPVKNKHSSLRDLCGRPVIVATAVRLALVSFALAARGGARPQRAFWNADTPRYLELAGSLLRGEFSTSAGAETYRLPGYPLLLSPGVALGVPTAWAVFIQVLLCALLVCLVVTATREIGFDDRAAEAAGLLCAVEPTLLLWSLLLMADAPLGLLATATLLALIVYVRRGKSAALAWAAGFAAMSALVKPVAYGLALVVALVAGFGARAKGHALRMFLSTSLVAGVVLGAWHLRNWASTGELGFSSQFSQANRSADFDVWRERHPNASEEEISAEWRRQGLDVAPGAAAAAVFDLRTLPERTVLHFRGVVRTLVNPGVITWLQFLSLEPRGMAATNDYLRDGGTGFLRESTAKRPAVLAATAVLLIANLGYWALFVVGFRRLLQRDRQSALAIGLFIGYFALVSGGPWAQSRFRVPFCGALCVVAGAAFDRRLKATEAATAPVSAQVSPRQKT